MSSPPNRLSWLISDVLPQWQLSLSVFCHRSTSYFYWAVALFLTLFIAASNFIDADLAAMDEGTFDTVMKMRWTSPPASQEIAILDIDEKSLAEMASQYGRWPWKREVFAQALAELEYIEAKSIMFTVLITDRDTEHPHSDAILSFVASESFVTVYPVVRLSAKNDVYSKLKVCDLIPAGVMKCKTDKTMAAILPALPGMQHDLGMMNHRLDDDGTLRHWTLLWEEESWKMPTMVGGAIALAHIEARVDKDESYTLNWRNKKNRYLRVSFSDYLATLEGADRIAPDFFKGKHVIIAASAPGLTIQNSTSIGLMDDGEILATALDDAINGTYLKSIPDWLSLLLTIGFIWGMAFLFMFRRAQRDLDSSFIAIEVGAVLIMALAINYTTYFIDIMPMATYGLIYYTIGRTHHEMAETIFMGATSYLDRIAKNDSLNSVGIIVFKDEENHFLPGKRDMLAIQKKFDAGKIFFCHESFREDQVLEGGNDVSCMVVISNKDAQHDILEKLHTCLQQRGLKDHITQTFDFPDKIKRNRKLIPGFITMKTLCAVTQLPLDEGKPER
ncbi:MAG: CHASE2 domain-containing protein [Mariprofundaceae bacterium]